VIQGDGAYTEERFAGLRFGSWKVGVFENIYFAVLFEEDRFHDGTQGLRFSSKHTQPSSTYSSMIVQRSS
jgi:hypothetical protein